MGAQRPIRATRPVQAAGTSLEDVRRAFYDQAPPTAAIQSMQLDPLQLIVEDSASGTLTRVPVELGTDGSVSFGQPVPVQIQYQDAEQVAAKAAASARAERHIGAAIQAGRIAPERAAHYRAKATAGEDISYLDTLAVVPPALKAAGGGRARSQEDEEYEALFGARQHDQDDGGPEYAAFFPTTEQDRRRVDAREAAAAKAAASLSDDALFEELFGKGGSR